MMSVPTQAFLVAHEFFEAPMPFEEEDGAGDGGRVLEVPWLQECEPRASVLVWLKTSLATAHRPKALRLAHGEPFAAAGCHA